MWHYNYPCSLRVKSSTKVARCCFRVQSESLNRRSGRCDLGSMPDLRTVRQLPVLAPIPRNEAMLLCHQKREELQLIFEQQQQRSRHSIVLRLGDFKVRILIRIKLSCSCWRSCLIDVMFLILQCTRKNIPCCFLA